MSLLLLPQHAHGRSQADLRRLAQASCATGADLQLLSIEEQHRFEIYMSADMMRILQKDHHIGSFHT